MFSMERIFDVFEGSFDAMLAAIPEDDLFVGKIAAVREQDPLAEKAPLQCLMIFRIDAEFTDKPSAIVATGLDDAPVTLSSDRVVLEARHGSYMQYRARSAA